MHVRGAATVAALALLLCAADSARLPLATAGAQYDKCTVEPPGKHPFIIRQDGTDHYCCRTKLTANKFVGCCYNDPVVYLPCHDSKWRIRCHGIYSIGSSWAKTGTDPKSNTPCDQNAQSVVYVANGGSTAVAPPTPSASQEPRVATIGTLAEPDDTPAAASTPERSTAPTSALGGPGGFSDCSGPYLGVVRYCGAMCCCELWQSGITCTPRWFAQVNQVVTVVDENYACCCTKTPGAGFTGHDNGVAPCIGGYRGPAGLIAIRAAKGMSTLAPDGRVYNAGLGSASRGGAPGTPGENVVTGGRLVVVDSGGPTPKSPPRKGVDYVDYISKIKP